MAATSLLLCSFLNVFSVFILYSCAWFCSHDFSPSLYTVYAELCTFIPKIIIVVSSVVYVPCLLFLGHSGWLVPFLPPSLPHSITHTLPYSLPHFLPPSLPLSFTPTPSLPAFLPSSLPPEHGEAASTEGSETEEDV